MMDPIYVDTLVNPITDRISAHIAKRSRSVNLAINGFGKLDQLPPDYQRAFLDGVVYLSSPYAKIRKDAGWLSNVVELLDQTGDLHSIRAKCQNNVMHGVYGMTKLMELMDEMDLFPEPPPEEGDGDDDSEGEGEEEGSGTADFIENGNSDDMSGDERMEMRGDAQGLADGMSGAIDDIGDLTEAFGMTPYGEGIEGQSEEDYPEELIDSVAGDVRLQNFIRAIGRAINGFESVRRGPPVSPPLEPAIGDNIEMLQPHEFLMMSVARREFFYRLSESRLDIIKQKPIGSERGPFVCAVDRSGSMGWDDDSREHNYRSRTLFTAMVLGIAATILAHRDGRRVRFMTFNAYISRKVDFGPWDSRGKVFAKLLDVARDTVASGSTDISAVQDEAMDFKEETDDQGDLLLVTDGATSFRERTDDDPRYFLVNIGRYSAAKLDEMCENSIRVEVLNEDSENIVINNMAEAISC